MAVNIQHQFQVNISNTIEQSISTVVAIRQTSRAKKEAAFQKAIADGMSYQEQLAFREKQLEEEKSSSFIDNDYVAYLDKSIAETKKLNRFNNYRMRYTSILGQLSSGAINEQKYLQSLKESLVGIEDPELKLEIQKDIVEAERVVKQYKDNILQNQISKAKYDGTQNALNSAITAVKNARATALINENMDEVTAYDETLGALGSQLATVRIQDSLTDFQVRSSTRGTTPLDKLNFVNEEIGKANPNQPIRIGDKTYNSAQEFWTLERDSFLQGNSSILGDFFTELKTFADNTVNANTVKFGYPTQVVLDDINKTLTDLGSRQEMQPYLNKFEITKASVMAGAVDKFAQKVIDTAQSALEFSRADIQLDKIQKQYGVDTSAYRNSIFQTVRDLEQAKKIDPGQVEEIATRRGDVEFPEITGQGASDANTPKTQQTSTDVYTIKSGDTLGAIARNANITMSQLLDLNPEFRTNPNMIKPGQNVKLQMPTPVTTTAPTEPVPEKQQTAITEPTLPGGQVEQPKPVAPTTPAMTPPKTEQVAQPKQTAQTYSGGSITDYLKSTGADSSYAARQKLASEKGIQNYTGTAQQNSELLKLLRG